MREIGVSVDDRDRVEEVGSEDGEEGEEEDDRKIEAGLDGHSGVEVGDEEERSADKEFLDCENM
ncbi:hypothetical protein WAI453_006701 [Rhynchosporium graminicola]